MRIQWNSLALTMYLSNNTAALELVIIYKRLAHTDFSTTADFHDGHVRKKDPKAGKANYNML